MLRNFVVLINRTAIYYADNKYEKAFGDIHSHGSHASLPFRFL